MFIQNIQLYEAKRKSQRGGGGGDSHTWPDGDASRNF